MLPPLSSYQIFLLGKKCSNEQKSIFLDNKTKNIYGTIIKEQEPDLFHTDIS
jgi:hypothetical protein